jgi:hypothetical protein
MFDLQALDQDQDPDIIRRSAIVVSPAVASSPDSADVGAALLWGENAPLDNNGRPQARFWHIQDHLKRSARGVEAGTTSENDRDELSHAQDETPCPPHETTPFASCQRTMLQDAIHFAETLCQRLNEILLGAVVVPADPTGAPASRAQSAFSEAVDSLDKASRYASQLRATLEGRPERPTPNATVNRTRMTKAAHAHLVALLKETTTIVDALTKVASLPEMDGTGLDNLLSIIKEATGGLVRQLCTLRTDLQAAEIEHQPGIHIERSLASLVQVLLNNHSILSEKAQ